MVAVAPSYPQIEVADGWTREVKGPRIWLIPPAPGGRVVVAPLQARPKDLPPERFLEMILVKEADRIERLKQTQPVPFSSTQGTEGLIVDVAALDEDNKPFEWRCYALLATPKAFGLMFAQIHPSKHDELRRAFLGMVKTVVMPSHEAVEAAPPLEPWGEL